MKGLNVQMLFNPQSCSLEILEATLTEKRRKLAETILSQIEDSIASKGSHNNLIIGPRGTGKTHVLHYIRRILREKRYPGNDVCNVIALSEDERGITSMLHFLIACLRAAGVENEKLIIMLDPDDRVRAVEDAENLFRQITRQKPTLLIMENLSDIFDGLGKEDMPKLRAFLQSNPYISILASSIFLFKESNKPDHPFYGYFSIHPLPFLDSREAREFLILLSKVNDKNNLNSILNTDLGQKRVNAIHHLTGGNHRLLSMLSHFLNSEGLDELVVPFQQMVDRELTPYYQQRLDRLTRQQFQIVQSIADQHGKALSVKEIALYSFLDQNVISRQLYDLISSGYVQRKPVGRESCYELREPLLRLVLDIKEGRDRPLSLIVEILKEWYDSGEIISLMEKAKGEFLPYYQMALAEKEKAETEKMELAAPELSQRIEKSKRGLSDFERKFLDEIEDLIKQGKLQEAEAKADVWIRKEKDNPETLFLLGAIFQKTGQFAKSISLYDQIIKKFMDSQIPELLEKVAMSLVNKGVALGSQGKPEEAIACYNEVIERYSGSENRELLEKVGHSYLNKIAVLIEKRREKEGLELTQEILKSDILDKGQRTLLTSFLFDNYMGNIPVLRKIREIFKDDLVSITGGLISWIQSILPISGEKARELEKPEENLKSVFGDIPETEMVLNILSAARRDALGDKKALLEIPLELRQLILSKK